MSSGSQPFREWQLKHKLLDHYSESATPEAKEFHAAVYAQLKSDLVDRIAEAYGVDYAKTWNIIHDFMNGCINGDVE